MEWLESDVARAVGSYFAGRGYEIRYEVQGCDVVASRKEKQPEQKGKKQKLTSHLIAIETKLKFNLKLLYQGVNRLDSCDEVYLAFLRPPNLGRGSSWRDIKK